MMNEDTPPKMREIIMDTWPQLYWLKVNKKNIKKTKKLNTLEGA